MSEYGKIIETEVKRQHREKFTLLAEKLGIGWPDENEKFMGRTLQQWSELYAKDEHLNNVPLREFDAYYGPHLITAHRNGLKGWSYSDTTCVLKTVIINKILANRGK
ncbi:MAG: hypothetical protein SVK08_04100 [Halobacteriota archaeon]|nr:hypothetical protein [Halobacteriota archaeon]